VQCFNQSTGSIDLSITGGSFPYFYTWTNALGTFNASTQDIFNIPAGGYSVTVTDFNGCSVSANYTLTQPPSGAVISSNVQPVFCFGDSTGWINATVIGGALPYAFTWSNGDLGNTTTAYTTDTLFVYVSNPITCCVVVDTIIPTLTTSGLCDLDLPNVFTPNNDGDNDYFQLLYFGGLKTFHCAILNRWGQVIREYDNPAFTWDGKTEAQNDVVEGVYFYLVNAETVGGNEIIKHGHITLIR
jgi:gliding motility-associated-like protein